MDLHLMVGCNTPPSNKHKSLTHTSYRPAVVYKYFLCRSKDAGEKCLIYQYKYIPYSSKNDIPKYKISSTLTGGPGAETGLEAFSSMVRTAMLLFFNEQ